MYLTNTLQHKAFLLKSSQVKILLACKVKSQKAILLKVKSSHKSFFVKVKSTHKRHLCTSQIKSQVILLKSSPVKSYLSHLCSSQVKSKEALLLVSCDNNIHCTGLYASFLKGQGHQGISLVKCTLWTNYKFLLAEHIKGTKAMTRGHRGNHCVASVKHQARLQKSSFRCYLLKTSRSLRVFNW